VLLDENPVNVLIIRDIEEELVAMGYYQKGSEWTNLDPQKQARIVQRGYDISTQMCAAFVGSHYDTLREIGPLSAFMELSVRRKEAGAEDVSFETMRTLMNEVKDWRLNMWDDTMNLKLVHARAV
jgi:hypothetical protein